MHIRGIGLGLWHHRPFRASSQCADDGRGAFPGFMAMSGVEGRMTGYRRER